MPVKIYKDDSANSIFIEDANGAQFLNSLHASVNADDLVNIEDLAKGFDIVSATDHTEFVDENDVQYPGDAVDVCNELNAIFQASGTPSANPPTITSSLAISSTQGDTINYELTADFGVGYEWDFSNVPGVVNVEGNPRKIIGGSGLTAGVYSIPVTAINYNGEDSKTIELTVGTPAFANTKSVRFNNNDWLNANAGILQNVLGRTGNGSGASDAWSISLWFKPGTSGNSAQTIFYFGNQDVANQGYIQLKYNGNNNGGKKFEFRYGTNNNRINLISPVGGLAPENWYHVLITYDGGTTGAASGSVNDYYSRFKFFIDGALSSTTNTNNNFGYTGSILPQNLRVGRWNNSQYLRNNCKVDELAIFDEDVSALSSQIYGGGAAVDLMNLATQPKHWWRMGDGDTFPFLNDVGTEANCIFVMQNMTSADIVNDVPSYTLNVSSSQYLVSGVNNGQLLNMLYPNGWTLILPELSTVPSSFSFTVRNLISATNTGTISTFASETIDGLDDIEANGAVELTLTKQSGTEWVTSNLIQYSAYLPASQVVNNVMTINDTVHAFPVNRIIDFANVDTIVLNHESGSIPNITVWLSDGQGGYSDASVDIDHDWSAFLSSTINLNQTETGKLVYTFN